MEKSTRNSTLLLYLVGLYILAHCWVLLLNGIYWDDWLIYQSNFVTLADRYTQMGLPFLAQFHYGIMSMGGVLTYRIITFGSYLLAALCLYAILKRMKNITAWSRFMIVAVFILFPVNSARIAIIDSWYSLCYGLFFLACYLMDRGLLTQRKDWRYLAECLFFVSFFTNSFVVFYFIVIIYVWMNRIPIGAKRSWKQICSYWDLVVLPLAFGLVKWVWFMPWGLYQGYNEIHIMELIHGLSPMRLIYVWQQAFVVPIDQAFNTLHYSVILLAVGVTVFSYLKLDKRLQRSVIREHYLTVKILTGLLLLCAAIFPYLSVTHSIDLSDWNSRNQLLVPLGAAVFITYLLLNRSCYIRLFVCSLLILLFISSNIQTYLSYELDWYKQVAMMRQMQSNQTIREHTSFWVDDRARKYDVNRRTYRFYEYCGMMKAVFGDETRFAAPWNTRDQDFYGHYLAIDGVRRQYNLADYLPQTPNVKIIIEPGHSTVTLVTVAMMRYYELIGSNRFDQWVDDLVTVTTEPV